MNYRKRSISPISSPIHIAIIANNRKNLKKLISFKIDVNVAYGNEGNTPLIEVCKRGYVDLIDYLLKANAMVSISNRIGKTADQYLEEIIDRNRSTLLKDKKLDIFELYILKLKKYKHKEELNKIKQALANQEIKIKENKFKGKKAIGFKF